MTVKNFVFREKMVENKVACMKITFLVIFTLNWTHILVPKHSNIEFLEQHFDFQSIRKTEDISLMSL